jgi:hypothetical protein
MEIKLRFIKTKVGFKILPTEMKAKPAGTIKVPVVSLVKTREVMFKGNTFSTVYLQLEVSPTWEHPLKGVVDEFFRGCNEATPTSLFNAFPHLGGSRQMISMIGG